MLSRVHVGNIATCGYGTKLLVPFCSSPKSWEFHWNTFKYQIIVNQSVLIHPHITTSKRRPPHNRPRPVVNAVVFLHHMAEEPTMVHFQPRLTPLKCQNVRNGQMFKSSNHVCLILSCCSSIYWIPASSCKVQRGAIWTFSSIERKDRARGKYEVSLGEMGVKLFVSWRPLGKIIT